MPFSSSVASFLHPLGPNAVLIGIPASREQLQTPCLVLDRPALEANIAAAAQFVRSKGIALRPHAKSHKSCEIARMQIAAGAPGVCTASVGEAEALAQGGISDILITSIQTQRGKLVRAARLRAGGCRVRLVADDPGVVDLMAAAAGKAGVVFDVLVDVDLGRKRNGVTSVAQALAVAARIAAHDTLIFGGLQTYASHISHVVGYAERRAASEEAARSIVDIRQALEAAGHTVDCVTGGSTGTLFIEPDLGCYTEQQAGSYVFNDVEYGSIDLDGAHGHRFAPSLFVRVSVIGRSVPGRVTCDGGNKHFSAKGTLPGFTAPPVRDAIYRPDSDEHGIIELPDGARQPALGSSFELMVPHCDPTVNLYSHYHVVDDDRLIAIWPIEARGAF